ncbi:hypothetical protein U1Q18_032466, partial [Sarracenia purpurea var. burkii]
IDPAALLGSVRTRAQIWSGRPISLTRLLTRLSLFPRTRPTVLVGKGGALLGPNPIGRVMRSGFPNRPR